MQFELAPKVDVSILDTLTEEERTQYNVSATTTRAAVPPSAAGSKGAAMGFGGHLRSTPEPAPTSFDSAKRGMSTALTVVADAVKSGGVAGGAAPGEDETRQLKMKGGQQATVTHMTTSTFQALEKERIRERNQEGRQGNLMFSKTREEEAKERMLEQSYFGTRKHQQQDGEEESYTAGLGSKRGRPGEVDGESEGRVAKKSRALSPPVEPVAEIDGKHQYDYQGRSFLHSQLRPTDKENTLPSKVVHVWKGQKAPGAASAEDTNNEEKQTATPGITALHWLPPSGHLLFTANMEGLVSLLDVATHRECVARYQSHGKAITSLTVSNDGGRHFSTASYDGTIRVWDTERAECTDTIQCSSALTGEQVGGLAASAYCKVHKYHPVEENSHLLLSGVGRKVLLWDLRTKGKVAREYDRHQGNVLSLTYLDRLGTKFISTAEDKTVRTWDFNVPVQIQVFADTSMHAVPHIAANPPNRSFILQSLDNEAYCMQLSQNGNSLKVNKDRRFTGHLVSGSSCTIQASPDGCFVSSGDVKGNIFFWDYQTGKKVKNFRAHGTQLAQHLWHPSFPGTVVTGSWDGTVKMWA